MNNFKFISCLFILLGTFTQIDVRAMIGGGGGGDHDGDSGGSAHANPSQGAWDRCLAINEAKYEVIFHIRQGSPCDDTEAFLKKINEDPLKAKRGYDFDFINTKCHMTQKPGRAGMAPETLKKPKEVDPAFCSEDTEFYWAAGLKDDIEKKPAEEKAKYQKIYNVIKVIDRNFKREALLRDSSGKMIRTINID